jgi:hypothetical protein
MIHTFGSPHYNYYEYYVFAHVPCVPVESTRLFLQLEAVGRPILPPMIATLSPRAHHPIYGMVTLK